MRKFYFLSLMILLSSLLSQASPNELVGKWAAPCHQANDDATEFTSTLNEFKVDGTIEAGNLVFGDSQCLGPVIGSEPKDIATYTATQNTLKLSGEFDGHTFQITANYKIVGNLLTWFNIIQVIDGRRQPVDNSVEFRKVK